MTIFSQKFLKETALAHCVFNSITRSTVTIILETFELFFFICSFQYLDDYIVQFTVSAPNLQELLSANYLKKLCALEEGLFKILKNYKGIAYTSQAWSISSYALCLADKQNCSKLTDEDLVDFRQSVMTCLQHRSSLWACYRLNITQSCNQLPSTCQNSLYSDLFYYILSNNDLTNNNTEINSKVFLPVQLYYVKLRYDKTTPFEPYKRVYDYISASNAEGQLVKIRGVDIGQKNFQLITTFYSELPYFYISIGAVALLLLCFTTSIFFTFMSTIGLLLTFGVSYFWYRLVIGVDYLPFSNFTIYLVVITVWIEDPLVLISLWRNYRFVKTAEPSNLDTRLNRTLWKFWRILAIKTLTSGSVLAVSIITDIIAIKCACLFGVLLVAVNFLLSITWTISALVIQVRWLNPIGKRLCPQPMLKLTRKLHSHINFVSNWLNENVLEKFAFLWIIFFIGLTVAAGVIVLFKPKMTVPTVNPTQSLQKNHLLEWQDTNNERNFENLKYRRAIGFRLVWGISGLRWTNPFRKPNEISYRKSRKFRFTNETIFGLIEFCSQVKRSEISRNPTIFGSTPTSCWAESFDKWSRKQNCNSARICCNIYHRKFVDQNMQMCLLLSTQELWHPENGPIFDNNANRSVVAFSQSFESIFNFSLKYNQLKETHIVVAEVLKNISEVTNSLMPSLIFTFDPELSSWYDMQLSLLTRMKEGLGIATLLVFFGLLFSLQNILMSFLALITIMGSVLISYAILTLIDWHLNITEAIFFILIASLSNNGSVINAVLNRKSRTSGEKSSASVSLITVVNCVAGAVLIGREVLILHQIGVCLVVFSSISWLCSTFYLYCLLHFRRWCGARNPTEHRDRLKSMFKLTQFK